METKEMTEQAVQFVNKAKEHAERIAMMVLESHSDELAKLPQFELGKYLEAVNCGMLFNMEKAYMDMGLKAMAAETRKAIEDMKNFKPIKDDDA